MRTTARTLIALAVIAACLIAPASRTFAREPLRARHAIVASTSPIASRVGADIMKKGGNAADAAVAVALALAVTWPSAGNLGGGGFMLIRKADGAAEAIDYRERAPLAATRDMYLDANGNVVPGLSLQGGKAAAVPGTIAGLVLVHKRLGKLPWSELVKPARLLAEKGFTVDYALAKSLRSDDTNKKLAPFVESRRIYQRDGRYFEMGETLVQPELAKTLGRIEKNPRDFYEGETARLIVEEMKRGNGIITLEDLRTYEPTVRKPLRGWYRGYEIITMPPPSSGGIALLEMLHMLEPYDLRSMGWNSSQYVHTVTETMRRAFADRASFLGDTDFVKAPVDTLISSDHAAGRAKDIDATRATPSVSAGTIPGYESPQTTHFTIVDQDGNVVTNTYTLNDSYGAGLTVKGAGFILNNEMDDFTSKPGVPNDYGLLQSAANAIAPRKRPLSSMVPTIVLKDGKLAFAIGSPGGPTIISTVLHVILNTIDFGMNLQQAIDAPRFHHQWMPDQIEWEEFGMSADTRARLEAMGHAFRTKASVLGDAQGIAIDATTGMRMGASDPRLGGTPAGW